MKPRSAGGQDLTSNLVPACQRCNSDKGSQDWKEWFRAQPFYSEMRETEIEAWMQQGRIDGPELWEEGVDPILSVSFEDAILQSTRRQQ